MSHEVPSRPWEKIATDNFTLRGKDYLVTVDYYCNYWEIYRLPNTNNASNTILKLESLCPLRHTRPSDQQQRQQTQAKYYNRSTKEPPSLSEGDVVRMKPFKRGDKSWPKAQVTARLVERSYTVEKENGALYRGNRQHLRKTSELPIESQNAIESLVSEQQPNAASASEKAVTTTTVTPSKSGAPATA